MKRWVASAVVALALPFAAWGQEVDYLVTAGKLSQEDFYRLVSCRALPGGPCMAEPVRWSHEDARDLRIYLAPVPPDYPAPMARMMDVALDRAITEINNAGAALHLTRVGKGSDAPVTVHLSPVNEGEPIRGTGIPGIDGQPIGAALVTVWWDDVNHITEAVIVLAADLPPSDVLPVVLEELSQAMGLLTDIRNPTYESISVFSEDSNWVNKLGPQDRAALRRHYAPQ